jgi:hypothetical protein
MSAVQLFAQMQNDSVWQWNHDAVPSFREPLKKSTSKIFLPFMPTKDSCTKNTIEVDAAYRNDSIKFLSIFLKSEVIPNDLATHLIPFRNTNKPPIIALPNLMTGESEPCTDGFIASWSNEKFSFFYIDTATCVVLGIKVNPKSNYMPDSEYEAMRLFLTDAFEKSFNIDDEFFLDEKVFSKKPLQVAAYYKRPIMDNERDKKTAWGLTGNFSILSNSLTTVFFRCEKNIPDDIANSSLSRFSKQITMNNLVPVTAKRLKEEKQKSAQHKPTTLPTPANTASPKVIQQIKEHETKINAAEKN